MKIYILEETNSRVVVPPMVFLNWNEGYKELVKRYEKAKDLLNITEENCDNYEYVSPDDWLDEGNFCEANINSLYWDDEYDWKLGSYEVPVERELVNKLIDRFTDLAKKGVLLIDGAKQEALFYQIIGVIASVMKGDE